MKPTVRKSVNAGQLVPVGLENSQNAIPDADNANTRHVLLMDISIIKAVGYYIRANAVLGNRANNKIRSSQLNIL